MTPNQIAIALMRAIMYDNGWVNRLEPEYVDPQWVERIAPDAGRFFGLHPHLLTSEVIDEIVTEDYDTKMEKYGTLEGFTDLDETLNAYFENSGAPLLD